MLISNRKIVCFLAFEAVSTNKPSTQTTEERKQLKKMDAIVPYIKLIG